jgi:K+-transporting ATPase ATPase C chain
MLKELSRIIMVLVVMTVLTGVAYPLAVTGVAQVLFPAQAEGSLIRDKEGRVIGSELVAQNFSADGYFHPRPSAAGKDGYDASSSSGSNLGPTSKALIDRITTSVADLRLQNATAPIPADLVTTSGSGLDPHISPDAALFQIPRISKTRGIPEDKLRALVAEYTESPTLGVIGAARVNVLKLNLALGAPPG